MPKDDAFYIEEFKALRETISTKLKDQLESNRWGLIGLAALYSYILSNPGKPILFWVPVGLTLAMLALLNEENRMIQIVGKYIEEQLEPWAADGNKIPRGWETYLGDTTTPRWWLFWHRWPRGLWDWAPVPLWLLLFALTLGIALGVSLGLWPSLSAAPINCSK
jgi:hypothetical protein